LSCPLWAHVRSATAVVITALALLAAACSADNPIAAPTTTTTRPRAPSTTSQPATTTVPAIDPAAYGTWTLDTDDPSVAWLSLPKHKTLTAGISEVSGPFASTSMDLTLGCNRHGSVLHQLIPTVKTDDRLSTLRSCGSVVDSAEDRIANLVFSATAVHLNGNELIFGDPPQQLTLRRTSDKPTTPTITNPAIYGAWEIAWDDPGLLIELPDDRTLNVTVSEAPPGAGRPWNLEITLGCQIWDTDLLAAHPYSEKLPDQVFTDCGTLAYTEQDVAFTILENGYPLSIDGGDLIFGAPPNGFYLHPVN